MSDTIKEETDFERTKRIVGKIKLLLSDSEKKLNLLLENEYLLKNKEIQESTAFIILGYSGVERILRKENIYLEQTSFLDSHNPL